MMVSFAMPFFRSKSLKIFQLFFNTPLTYYRITCYFQLYFQLSVYKKQSGRIISYQIHQYLLHSSQHTIGVYNVT